MDIVPEPAVIPATRKEVIAHGEAGLANLVRRELALENSSIDLVRLATADKGATFVAAMLRYSAPGLAAKEHYAVVRFNADT
jgi:hypothetical protein